MKAFVDSDDEEIISDVIEPSPKIPVAVESEKSDASEVISQHRNVEVESEIFDTEVISQPNNVAADSEVFDAPEAISQPRNVEVDSEIFDSKVVSQTLNIETEPYDLLSSQNEAELKGSNNYRDSQACKCLLLHFIALNIIDCKILISNK